MTDKIIEAAKAYRKFGWNVIPLYNYSKNPASSPFIRQRGWKEFEERTLTESEFNAAFGDKGLTGVGFITGAISRTVVLDEDSYKGGGLSVALESGMVSSTASGGRHIFGKYISPTKSMGFRKGVNVEGKGDGGFIVLPPSQVYRKDDKGKQTEEIGEYKWLAQCAWDMLPVISDKELEPFKPKESAGLVKLQEFAEAPLGEQHHSLRTVALSIFNRFRHEEWDIAEANIRAIAAKYKPAHPTWRVDKLIQDTKEYVLNHPKESFSSQKGIPAAKTESIDWANRSDEELDEIEQREELSTGLNVLDQFFTFKTGYYVICANPGAGKGWFATWLAKQFFIIHQKRSVFFSLEMAEPLVRTRVLQQWSGLTEQQLIGGNTTLAKKLMREGAMLVYPFGQDDAAYQTPENFIADVADFYSKGYRVFLFDHLHELDGSNDNNRNQKVIERWGKAFQTLCKNYPDIWLFIFAQPNGAAAGKAVLTRTDVAGSKSITQKCEVFISLNRKLLAVGKEVQQAEINQQDRSILLWIDKNRLSSQQRVGKFIHLSPTGNFTQDPASDVLPDAIVREVPQLSLLDVKKDEKREVN